jgi:hypothetical protein
VTSKWLTDSFTPGSLHAKPKPVSWRAFVTGISELHFVLLRLMEGGKEKMEIIILLSRLIACDIYFLNNL